MKALILAGGRGSRLNELTKNRNKSMIELFSKPLIEYNLGHATEAGVEEIIIVVGYRGEEIKRHIGAEYRGIKVRYVLQKKQRGLVNAIECAKAAIGDSDFILMLADEIIVDASLRRMVNKFREEKLFALCGITFEKDKASIGKTYSAMVNEKGRVFRLIEKPRFPINRIKGTGHCILKNEILEYIERTPINANRGEKELVDMIQCAVDEGKKVCVHLITKGYVNVNNKEDLELAKEFVRKSNPKVLIIHPQMRFYGGAELLLVELCNWLARRGIQNDVLTLCKSKEIEDALINTRLIAPKNDITISSRGFESAEGLLEGIKVLRKAAKRIYRDYDVVNFHNYPATWALWPRKKPCVWMLNEPPNLWSRPDAGLMLKMLNKIRNWFDKFVVRSSVDVICVADEFNRQRTAERYGKNSKIVYYGVNHDFFSKGDAKKAEKKWRLGGKFVVIQSGQLTEVKNQLESLKAVEKVRAKIPDILLVLAGKAEEEYKKKLDRYIQEHKLEKNVLFTGNLPRDSLRNLYAAANVGLFPVGAQGGWLAPFEMLCSGNPVIVSEEMGAASIIKKFDLGITTGDYAQALKEIRKNYGIYKKKAEKAAGFIQKNLGWDIFADKMIKAYRAAWKSFS